MRRTYHLIILLVRFYMKLIWNLKIINKERLNKNYLQNCIIAANHISWNDPPFISSILPIEINFLAKYELFQNKFFAGIITYLNAIPIKRGRIDRSALRTVQKRLLSGNSLLIFPEGTRRGKKAKAGIGLVAYRTKKDIIPIHIKNSDSFKECIFRKKNLQITIGEKIKIADYLDLGDNKKTFRTIANLTLKRINKLDENN